MSTPEGWRWECAGCNRSVSEMGMCETCGVFGIMRLAVQPQTGPHPDEPHEFRTSCLRCGEPGMLHISLLTPGERVSIRSEDVR